MKKFNSRYSQSTFKGTPKSDLPSLTSKEFGDSVNIDKLVKKYGAGRLASATSAPQTFTDLSGITDLADALDKSVRARDLFNSLPSDVREYFNNDPVALLQNLNNPDIQDDLVKLGLKDPKPRDQAPSLSDAQTPGKPGNAPASQAAGG